MSRTTLALYLPSMHIVLSEAFDRNVMVEESHSVREQSMDQNTRLAGIRRVLWIVLALNLLVASAKLIYGFISNSASMQADGIHSFFDSTGNIIGLIGIRLASKPADVEHPYGHRKYETYASTIIGLLLVIAGLSVGWEAIQNLLAGSSRVEVTPISFIVMAGTLGINIGVTTYEHRAAKQLGSEVLAADARHTLSDALVSIGVIIGLICVQLGFPLADPIAALIVTVIIFYTAFEVFKSSAETFSDHVRIPVEEVTGLIKSHGAVAECHEVRTRGTQSAVYLDCHILVNAEWTVRQAHDLASHLEKDLRDAHPQLVDVMIHIEPDLPEERKA